MIARVTFSIRSRTKFNKNKLELALGKLNKEEELFKEIIKKMPDLENF